MIPYSSFSCICSRFLPTLMIHTCLEFTIIIISQVDVRIIAPPFVQRPPEKRGNYRKQKKDLNIKKEQLEKTMKRGYNRKGNYPDMTVHSSQYRKYWILKPRLKCLALTSTTCCRLLLWWPKTSATWSKKVFIFVLSVCFRLKMKVNSTHAKVNNFDIAFY